MFELSKLFKYQYGTTNRQVSHQMSNVGWCLKIFTLNSGYIIGYIIKCVFRLESIKSKIVCLVHNNIFKSK